MKAARGRQEARTLRSKGENDSQLVGEDATKEQSGYAAWRKAANLEFYTQQDKGKARAFSGMHMP